jgi:folate-binding protein YgfZ
MNNEWNVFLVDAGAVFESDHQNTLTGNILCDLTHLGLIEIQGDDAETFLQGQATNDIAKINTSTSQPGSFCNPKGRIMASYRMFRRGDSYFLLMPEEMIEAMIKRLQMFVMMSKVTIVDASDGLIRLGVSGEQSAVAIHSALGDVPAELDQVMEVSDVTIIRVSGEQPRFIVFGDLENAKQLWGKLSKQYVPAGAASWRLLDIKAGYPTIYLQTKEAFVPQMVNLELIEGVSFKKGCYTGQEIVARMHYLGKLKRRMYPLHFSADESVTPGTVLYSAENKTDQPIGTIVDSAPSTEGGVDALAVLTIKYAEEGSKVYLESLSGFEAEVGSPPYELTS